MKYFFFLNCDHGCEPIHLEVYNIFISPKHFLVLNECNNLSEKIILGFNTLKSAHKYILIVFCAVTFTVSHKGFKLLTDIIKQTLKQLCTARIHKHEAIPHTQSDKKMYESVCFLATAPTSPLERRNYTPQGSQLSLHDKICELVHETLIADTDWF